ncbi:MAG: hypothetical protein DIKNOCCD_00265 [bacterium]|nr:hypothetical protein [bacterium]
MKQSIIQCLMISMIAGSPFSLPGNVAPPAQAETVRVMSFNIWVGGEAGGQKLEQTVEVIRKASPDIVGLQEVLGPEVNKVRPDNGKKIADSLGWNYFNQGDGTAIITHYPILASTPRKWGIVIQHPSGKRLFHFNVHFNAAPYQPYQFLKIPYHDAPFFSTEAELIQAARDARGKQVDSLLTELPVALMSGAPVFLTGDFNEPSFQDWTQRAEKAGVCPVKVEFPATHSIAAAGMKDAFRSVFPDEVARPGWTWTPTTSPDDPKDHHDRIDYVWYAGEKVDVLKTEIVGEKAEAADILATPYPSDHRGVVATIRID